MSKQKYLPHKMAQDVCRSCTWWRSGLQAKTPLVSGVPREPLPCVPGDKGFSGPTRRLAGHWSSSAPSRRECWMVLSLVSSHAVSKDGRLQYAARKTQSLCKALRTKRPSFTFLKSASYFKAVTFSNVAPMVFSDLLYFSESGQGSLQVSQFPHQVTRPVGPGPGGPSFHCILTQTLRLRLRKAPASPSRILISHFLFWTEHSCELLLQNMATRCLVSSCSTFSFLFLCILCCFYFGVGLILDAVFVSGVWELNSVIHRHLSIILGFFFLDRGFQCLQYAALPLCYSTVCFVFLILCLMYINVCLFLANSSFIPNP